MHPRTTIFLAIPTLAASALMVVMPPEVHAQGLYQFQPGQRVRYDVTMMQDGETSEGYYEIIVEQAGGGQVRVTIDAQVGDDACNASSTVAEGASAAGQMMMTCFPLMSVAAALFSPAYMMFLGNDPTPGNTWSTTSGGETTSFEVTGACSYAGVEGMRMVMRRNGETQIETCYSSSAPLPLYTMFRMDDDGDYVELEATTVQGM
jgi:hypothetical protein